VLKLGAIGVGRSPKKLENLHSAVASISDSDPSERPGVRIVFEEFQLLHHIVE